MIERETIYAALFATLQAATDSGVVTASRKLRHWDDVSPAEMPAMFQAQVSEQAKPVTNLPTKWELLVWVWVYVRTEGAAAPGPVLNPILDAITNTLAFSALGRQTLGGLVEWARVEGTIETSEGNLGDVEVAKIPVKILIPE
jgi:hypothetical protein